MLNQRYRLKLLPTAQIARTSEPSISTGVKWRKTSSTFLDMEKYTIIAELPYPADFSEEMA